MILRKYRTQLSCFTKHNITHCVTYTGVLISFVYVVKGPGVTAITTTTTTSTSTSSKSPQPQQQEFSTDLVAEVVVNLKPVIASTVQATISGSNNGHTSNAQLVEQIVGRLQPEIKAVITRTVASQNYSRVSFYLHFHLYLNQ